MEEDDDDDDKTIICALSWSITKAKLYCYSKKTVQIDKHI